MEFQICTTAIDFAVNYHNVTVCMKGNEKGGKGEEGKGEGGENEARLNKWNNKERHFVLK